MERRSQPAQRTTTHNGQGSYGRGIHREPSRLDPVGGGGSLGPLRTIPAREGRPRSRPPSSRWLLSVGQAVGVQNLIMQCRAVLLLVHELHLRGHQRLRAIPAMEPSGRYWRCAIAPVSLVSVNHGARLAAGVRDDPRIATYTSRDQNRYFGWTDIYPYAAPKELAMYFVERFPRRRRSRKGLGLVLRRVVHGDVVPHSSGPVSLCVGQGQGARCIFADRVSRNGPTEVAYPATTTW